MACKMAIEIQGKIKKKRIFFDLSFEKFRNISLFRIRNQLKSTTQN